MTRVDAIALLSKTPEEFTPKEQQLKKATQDFESLFLHTLLRQMRETSKVEGASLFGESTAQEVFTDMLDQEYAKAMAGSGGIGLGEMLFQELRTAIAEEVSQDEAAIPPTTEAEFKLVPATAYSGVPLPSDAASTLPVPPEVSAQDVASHESQVQMPPVAASVPLSDSELAIPTPSGTEILASHEIVSSPTRSELGIVELSDTVEGGSATEQPSESVRLPLPLIRSVPQPEPVLQSLVDTEPVVSQQTVPSLTSPRPDVPELPDVEPAATEARTDSTFAEAGAIVGNLAGNADLAGNAADMHRGASQNSVLDPRSNAVLQSMLPDSGAKTSHATTTPTVAAENVPIRPEFAETASVRTNPEDALVPGRSASEVFRGLDSQRQHTSTLRTTEITRSEATSPQFERLLNVHQRAEGPVGVRPQAGVSATTAQAPSSSLPAPGIVWEQFVRKLEVSIGQQRHTARIQLEPPELGRVDVHLIMRGNQLTMQIRTETQHIAEVVRSHLHDLQTAMQGRGIQVQQFDVGMGNNPRQFMENPHYGLPQETPGHETSGRENERRSPQHTWWADSGLVTRSAVDYRL